jgi:hypothetical protein
MAKQLAVPIISGQTATIEVSSNLRRILYTSSILLMASFRVTSLGLRILNITLLSCSINFDTLLAKMKLTKSQICLKELNRLASSFSVLSQFTKPSTYQTPIPYAKSTFFVSFENPLPSATPPGTRFHRYRPAPSNVHLTLPLPSATLWSKLLGSSKHFQSPTFSAAFPSTQVSGSFRLGKYVIDPSLYNLLFNVSVKHARQHLGQQYLLPSKLPSSLTLFINRFINRLITLDKHQKVFRLSTSKPPPTPKNHHSSHDVLPTKENHKKNNFPFSARSLPNPCNPVSHRSETSLRHISSTYSPNNGNNDFIRSPLFTIDTSPGTPPPDFIPLSSPEIPASPPPQFPPLLSPRPIRPRSPSSFEPAWLRAPSPAPSIETVPSRPASPDVIKTILSCKALNCSCSEVNSRGHPICSCSSCDDFQFNRTKVTIPGHPAEQSKPGFHPDRTVHLPPDVTLQAPPPSPAPPTNTTVIFSQQSNSLITLGIPQPKLSERPITFVHTFRALRRLHSAWLSVTALSYYDPRSETWTPQPASVWYPFLYIFDEPHLFHAVPNGIPLARAFTLLMASSFSDFDEPFVRHMYEVNLNLRQSDRSHPDFYVRSLLPKIEILLRSAIEVSILGSRDY